MIIAVGQMSPARQQALQERGISCVRIPLFSKLQVTDLAKQIRELEEWLRLSALEVQQFRELEQQWTPPESRRLRDARQKALRIRSLLVPRYLALVEEHWVLVRNHDWTRSLVIFPYEGYEVDREQLDVLARLHASRHGDSRIVVYGHADQQVRSELAERGIAFVKIGQLIAPKHFETRIRAELDWLKASPVDDPPKIRRKR